MSFASIMPTNAAVAFEKGDMLVRGVFATVAPSEASAHIIVRGNGLGLHLTVDKDRQIGVNFAYFVSDNISATQGRVNSIEIGPWVYTIALGCCC